MKVWAAIAYNASLCMSATMLNSPVLRVLQQTPAPHPHRDCRDAPDVRLERARVADAAGPSRTVLARGPAGRPDHGRWPPQSEERPADPRVSPAERPRQ